jgi:hypothetical protein
MRMALDLLKASPTDSAVNPLSGGDQINLH